jgi:hypothetical protein
MSWNKGGSIKINPWYLSFSRHSEYGSPLKFNLAMKDDGSRYYAGCPGSHVYTGKGYVELAHNVAKGILKDAYMGKDMALEFRSGDVYVRTPRGKRAISETVPAEEAAMDDFGPMVRDFMQEILQETLVRNAKKNEAFNAAEKKMTLEDYRILIGKKQEERLHSEAAEKEARELMDRTEEFRFRDSGYTPQPNYYRDYFDQ